MTTEENHVDILMPAHNEAAGIVRSLGSCVSSLRELDATTASSITVIANGCTDNTAEIADDWAKRTIKQREKIGFTVIELSEGHKIKALNEGIAQSECDITFVMDADVTLDPLGLPYLTHILSTQRRPIGASLYHAADPLYMPEGELSQIVQMGDLRRQAIPSRLKLHGGFMGWNSQAADKEGVHFPDDTPVSDDTWLSFSLIDRYGPGAIQSTNCGIFSRYIAAQTVADYISQHSRYAIADRMVSTYYPDLIPAINTANRAIPPLDQINVRWRELCHKQGIKFDESIGAYERVRLAILANQEKMIAQLESGNGQWEPVATTRLTTEIN